MHLLLLSKTEIDRHLRYKYHYHLAVSVLYNNPSSEIGFDKHVKLEFLIGGWLGGSVGRSVSRLEDSFTHRFGVVGHLALQLLTTQGSCTNDSTGCSIFIQI